MPTITRRLEFDYGHRIYGHEGKCSSLHGHRGVVDITITADALDKLGRVVDFGIVKQEVGGWIDRDLDHKMLLWKDDPLTPVLLRTGEDSGVVILVNNPTAENLAAFMYENAKYLLRHWPVAVTKVVFYETPNCSAEHPT